jgi:GH25 family lysozyme M1 (1,4-beta-N-acetylmuramidase)
LRGNMATPKQIRDGLDELRKYLGAPYVHWNGVWPPNQGIFYNVPGDPPPVKTVKERGILCSGAVSLAERCIDGSHPHLSTWGTLSIEQVLENRRPFKPGVIYPVGTILGYPFARDNDGHVVIVSTEPDISGDQMTIGADIPLGLNEARTVREAHQVFNFTYAGELPGIGVIPLGGGGGGATGEDSPFIDRPLFGLDLHPQYQFGFDFERARELGYEFVWIKGAEGPYRDGSVLPLPNFKAFVKEALAADFTAVGIYDYLLSTPTREQAEHYLRRLELVGGPEGFMIGPDFEGYGSPGDPYYYLTPDNVHLKEFNAHLDRELDNPPITVYSGPDFWKGGHPSGSFGQYGADVAWSAIWPNDTVDHDRPRDYYHSIKSSGWGKDWGGVVPRFWQFTSRGLVAGEYVDVNAFRGDRRMLRKLTVGGREPMVETPRPIRVVPEKVEAFLEPTPSEPVREDPEPVVSNPPVVPPVQQKPTRTGAKRGSVEGLILALSGAFITALPGVELPPGLEPYLPLIILALTTTVRTVEAYTLDSRPRRNRSKNG